MFCMVPSTPLQEATNRVEKICEATDVLKSEEMGDKKTEQESKGMGTTRGEVGRRKDKTGKRKEGDPASRGNEATREEGTGKKATRKRDATEKLKAGTGAIMLLKESADFARDIAPVKYPQKYSDKPGRATKSSGRKADETEANRKETTTGEKQEPKEVTKNPVPGVDPTDSARVLIEVANEIAKDLGPESDAYVDDPPSEVRHVLLRIIRCVLTVHVRFRMPFER